MFTEIVVGVNSSEEGRDTVGLAKRLVAQGGRLTLVHVLTGDRYIYRGASARYAAAEGARALEEREEAEALALLDSVNAQAELAELGVEVTLRCVTAASVGRGLHECAELERADLLALGTSRQRLLGRVGIGDDTHAALNGASCAIAIAPAGIAEQAVAMREIGVGYDGSRESEHALELARELAAQWDVKLSAFTAVSVSTAAFGSRRSGLPDAINALVNDARERIAALGGVEPHAAYGAAVEELTVYSASLDLLIVGSRGYGPIGRLIHGSTSAQLARTARCALLVLPRASELRYRQERQAVVGASA